MIFIQLQPGEEKDLTKEWNSDENPVDKVNISFKPTDPQSAITFEKFPKLHVCAKPGKKAFIIFLITFYHQQKPQIDPKSGPEHPKQPKTRSR